LVDDLASVLKTFLDGFLLSVAENRCAVDHNLAGLDFLEAAVGCNDVNAYEPPAGLADHFLAGGSDDTPFIQHLLHRFHPYLSLVSSLSNLYLLFHITIKRENKPKKFCFECSTGLKHHRDGLAGGTTKERIPYDEEKKGVVGIRQPPLD
jgi:hypothetical protein